MKTQIKNSVPADKEGAEVTQLFGKDDFSFSKEEDPSEANCVRVVYRYKHTNREFKKHDWTAVEAKIWNKWWITIKVEEHKEVKGNHGSRVVGKQLQLNKRHLIQFANNLLALAEKMEDNQK